MNDEELLRLVQALGDVLQPHLERSEPLRRLAASLGEWLVQQAAQAAPSIAAPPQPQTVSRSAALARELLGPGEPSSPQPAGALADPALVPLRIGDAVADVQVAGTAEEIGRARSAAAPAPAPPAPPAGAPYPSAGAFLDLQTIETRCRLKAEGCAVFVQRRAAAGDPLREQLHVDRLAELIARAKALPECFLWMFWRERTQPGDEDLRVIARCYEALAGAAGLMRRIDEATSRTDRAAVPQAMQLLAEACSALRCALQRSWLTAPDVDQDHTHAWLRRESSLRQVFLPRFMKLDDPADPEAAGDLIERVAALRSALEQQAQQAKSVDESVKQIRYHAGRLAQEPADDGIHHLRRITDGLERLTGLGVAPSDRRIAEALRALANGAVEAMMADADSPALRAAIAAARILIAGEARSELEEAEPVAREWSPRVHMVRAELAGRSVVIIGGEPRPPAAQRLEEAFALREVIWVDLSEHGSGDPMRAPIARPETALVLVLVKLAGHLHVEEARHYTRAAGKPLVYLKAGYNPEQVAEAVLAQAGLQLGLTPA